MNEQKKTVREWLNELPEPIRTRAIDNHEKDKYKTVALFTNMQRAVCNAFVFYETMEGEDYWKLVSEGKHSEACALLGETLQTEQIEPDNENELELTESEFFDVVADKVATEQYSKFWFELDDSQKAHLVKPIALRYAELVNNQKQ